MSACGIEPSRNRESGRQPKARLAAARARAVSERERAAVRFGDLAREDETYPRPARLRGEEGHEEVRGAGEAQALVLDPNLDVAIARAPPHAHRTIRHERRVRGVADEVDEELFELVGVRTDRLLRAVRDLDAHTRLKPRDAAH